MILQETKIQAQTIRFTINASGIDKDWTYENLATDFKDVNGSIETIMEHVLSGHALCAGNLGGKRRCKGNVIGSQYILVDIDNSDVERDADGKPIKDENGKSKKIYKQQLTIEEAKEHPFVKKHCALIYTTASHKPEWHKFRLIFILPEYIDDVATLEIAINYLQQKFPHDPTCKDASRVFYGSTKAEFPLVNPDALLPLDWIATAQQEANAKKLETEKRIQEINAKKEKFKKFENSENWNTDALIQEALNYIPARCPGSQNYNECTKVLMALVSHYGKEKAESIAENWSPSIKGDSWDIRKKIDSYKRDGVNIGTLFYIAKEHGFRFPSKPTGTNFGASNFKNKSANSSDGGDKKNKIPPADIFAKHLAEEYKDKFRWNNEHKCWMEYEKSQTGIWASIDDHSIECEIQNILELRGIEGYRSDSYIQNIRKFLSRKLNISQWNERKNILPFEDGIVNIATGSFETHCPENRLTWSLPRSYNNSNVVADWNAIRTWLAEISEGNENNFKSLTHFAAAVLRGRHDLQKVLYLWGDGGSGKGTYTRLLEAILGEINCWSGKIEWLDDPNQVARLLNKKLAIFADQDKVSGKLQSFKNLTGGDKLVGKHLYKDPFEFYFTGLGLITANFAALQGGGIGRWFERRIIAVKMNLAPERVRNLDAEFAPEIAAFTRYLLSISDEEINAVLRDENSTKHTDPNFWEMATRQDSLASWVEQHIIFDSNVRTRVGSNKNEYLYLGDNYNPEFATLFGSYHRYCHQGGLQGKGINNFSPDLEEILRKVLRHPEVERVKTREGSFFIGIRLRAANDDIPIISEAILRRDDHRDDPVTTAVTTSNPCGDRGDDSFHEKKVENSQSKREEENIPNGNGATNSEKVLPPLVTARVSSHHSHHNAEKSTPNEKISVSEFSLNMEVEVVDPELRDFYQQKGTITQILEDSRLLICFPASDTDPERASIFLPSEIRIVRHTSDNEQLDGF